MFTLSSKTQSVSLSPEGEICLFLVQKLRWQAGTVPLSHAMPLVGYNSKTVYISEALDVVFNLAGAPSLVSWRRLSFICYWSYLRSGSPEARQNSMQYTGRIVLF